ncbi:MAG: HAMP domain-containing histidine kinase [Bryobacterales bacterium]|nr:HAMP domain-containing histidine kinase [Bryobacterales bacterium]
MLYDPAAEAAPEVTPRDLGAVELFEFQPGRAAEAIAAYRRLADSPHLAMRAGALLRMGRINRNQGHNDQALQAYGQLAAMRDARVAGAPAELVARLAMAEILMRRDRGPEAIEQALRLRRGLEAGKWLLAHGQFLFYWQEVGRLLNDGAALPPAAALSEAASEACARLRESADERGTMIVRAAGAVWFVLWTRSGTRTAALFLPTATLLTPHQNDRRFRIELLDTEGKALAGEAGSTARSAIRMAAHTGLPWSVSVTPARSGSAQAAGRERFLTMILYAAIGFIALATWLMARLILREAAVSRLQSEFVSAVSHEFRSPLAAMRHLSELLAVGRVPEESRRQRYYETLTAEALRLQRLVETLLNFGRMEAGVQPYRFQRIDASSLATQVAGEFEPLVKAGGRKLDVSGQLELWIDADAEALSLAVRNLIDNALKYSPGCPTVWVACSGDVKQVTIQVRDEGVGIPPREQRLVFHRFVRGSSARDLSAPGTGVGLAMVQHIVREHGGKIELRSQAGGGSTFSLVLPASKSL